jgi:hypothetical protein
MIRGDITLAGVTLTLEEWEAIDPVSRAMLLELCAGPEPIAEVPAEASQVVFGLPERSSDVAALYDMLSWQR